MGFFKNIKEALSKGDIKRNISSLVALIIICIIILISWSVFFPESKNNKENVINENVKPVTVEKNNLEGLYQESIETKLENILSQIDGVGEVDVMITYEATAEVVPALNVTRSQQTTEENDKQGGRRIINQENTTENIVIVSDEGNNTPIVIKEIKPMIRGVIVVAEGADSTIIKNQLIDAVTTIFQIKSHKVKIYSKN